MREEQLRMTARAVVDVLDALDAGGAELRVGDSAKVEHAPVGRVVVVGEGIQYLVPDLVATATDARPDDGGKSGRIGGRRVAVRRGRAVARPPRRPSPTFAPRAAPSPGPQRPPAPAPAPPPPPVRPAAERRQPQR